MPWLEMAPMEQRERFIGGARLIRRWATRRTMMQAQEDQPLEIAPYNRAWPAAFESEAGCISGVANARPSGHPRKPRIAGG